jgi:serine phosphatase RsbU (regulator of sigma subunit)
LLASSGSRRAPDDLVRHLQRITDAALTHLDLDEMLDQVAARTCEALDADTMAISLQEGDTLVRWATLGSEGEPASHLQAPLAIAGQVIGTVETGSFRPDHFTEADARFLQLVADRVAQAVDRSRLFEAEREARTLAEETQRRLAFLTTAGEALARSLDWQTTLDTVVAQAVPFLGDWCAIDLVQDDGDLRCVAAAHRDDALTPLVRQLHDSRPPDRQAARGVGAVMRTGQAAFWPVLRTEDLPAVAGSPERLSMFEALAPCSAVVLPLRIRSGLVGAVTFVHSAAASGRHYGEADVSLAEELVRRAALALDNARLFEERSQVGRILQASLLPPHLPDIPGAEVDGVYQAGGEGVEVGGDFYDVFLTEPGDWALVVGDVCGKGAEAAAVTAMGRYTLRAAAMQARRPSRVLHVLNEAMLRQDPGRPFLTVAYARLQLGPSVGDPARVTVGCGGHPLPMVLRASGEVETVGRAGTLLGCLPELDVEDRTVDLRPGDALVLYTDGVEEARDASGAVLGPDGLRAELAQCAGESAAEINRRLHQAVTARQAGRSADDVAILTLRLV